MAVMPLQQVKPSKFSSQVHLPNKLSRATGDFIENSNDSRGIIERIKEESVKSALSSFKCYKAPGYNMIYPVPLQKGIDELTPYLIKIYRKSIAESIVPESWLQTRVFFIPNPGGPVAQW